MSSELEIGVQVISYSRENLRKLLLEQGTVFEHTLDGRQHIAYLDSYLTNPDISAKTIIAENNYIDRDYLADYSGYYVRCFREYRRWCFRLHFFSEIFDGIALEKFLLGVSGSGINEKTLGDSYIGFLVIKPLPETLIGRTCLRTYKEEDGRCFPIVRKYRANLLGINLDIKSLAFQEQDTVAAACATSALWSAFQGTGLLFQHEIPSPLQITKSAVERTPTQERTFPAGAGLTNIQMAEAIRGVGLDPLLLNVTDLELIKATSYAYLRCAIPVLITCAANTQTRSDKPTVETEDLGGHAITLCGFRLLETASAKPWSKGGLLLTASKIDKLYAHDDQVGPFARLELATEPLIVKNVEKIDETSDWFSCHWDSVNPIEKIYLPLQALIPIPTTIRIAFNRILSALIKFDFVLETIRSNGFVDMPNRIEWDIYLISANELKNEYRSNESLEDHRRSALLTTALPRFVWRVIATSENETKIDFVFDTTDIEQGPLLIKVIYHDIDYFVYFLKAAAIYSRFDGYQVERLQPQGKIWEYLLKIYAEVSSSE